MSDLDERLSAEASRDGVRFSESRHARLIERACGAVGDASAAASAEAAICVPSRIVFARVALAASVVIGVLFGRQWFAPARSPRPDHAAVARALSAPMTLADRAMSARPDVFPSMSDAFADFGTDAYGLVRTPIDQLRALAVQQRRPTTEATKATL